MSALLVVLSVLFVRPVPAHAWPLRLLLHAVALCACLLAALPGEASWRLAAGLVAALFEVALLLLLWRTGFVFQPGPARRLVDLFWLPAGVVVAAVGIAVAPDAVRPHGVLATGLAVLLAGLLAAVSGRGDGRTPVVAGGLLMAGNGLLLTACRLPEAGWVLPAGIVLLQGVLLVGLVRTATVPR